MNNLALNPLETRSMPEQVEELEYSGTYSDKQPLDQLVQIALADGQFILNFFFRQLMDDIIEFICLGGYTCIRSAPLPFSAACTFFFIL